MPSPCVKQESVYCFDDYYYLIENCVRNSPINFLIFFFCEMLSIYSFWHRRNSNDDDDNSNRMQRLCND